MARVCHTLAPTDGRRFVVSEAVSDMMTAEDFVATIEAHRIQLLINLSLDLREMVEAEAAAHAELTAIWNGQQDRLAQRAGDRSTVWAPAWEQALRATSTEGL